MLQHGGASLDEPEARGGGSPTPEWTAGVAPGRGPGGRDARSPPMPNDTGCSCWGWCSLLGLQMWSHT